MRIDLRERPVSEWTKLHRRDRVLLDGVDVTKQCFMADDVEGVVGVYLMDETGHFYKTGTAPDWGDAAQEIRKGVVTIFPPKTP